MKYTQNRKIEQVKKTTLVIGVDIAKNNHVARAIDYRGIELGKALTFKNSHFGFNHLLTWVKTLMKRATLLVETTKNSIWLTEGLTMARQELMTLLRQYQLLEEELQQLMNQIESIVKRIPGTQEIMTIPGVGLVTIAAF